MPLASFSVPSRTLGPSDWGFTKGTTLPKEPCELKGEDVAVKRPAKEIVPSSDLLHSGVDIQLLCRSPDFSQTM